MSSCVVYEVDMKGEGGWVTRVWLSRGICDDVSVSAEQFCQIVFDCVLTACYTMPGYFFRDYVCGALQSLCVAYMLVPALSCWEAYKAV